MASASQRVPAFFAVSRGKREARELASLADSDALRPGCDGRATKRKRRLRSSQTFPFANWDTRPSDLACAELDPVSSSRRWATRGEPDFLLRRSRVATVFHGAPARHFLPVAWQAGREVRSDGSAPSERLNPVAENIFVPRGIQWALSLTSLHHALRPMRSAPLVVG